MKRKFSPASIAAIIAGSAIILIVWLFQATLSYAFFMTITPASNPYFPWYGMGLTEVGFLLWLVVFLFSVKPFARIEAVIMAFLSIVTSLTLAYVQLNDLIASHYDMTQNLTRYQTVSQVLSAMMIANCLALFIKLVVWGFSQPGQGFFDPYTEQEQRFVQKNDYSMRELAAPPEPQEDFVFMEQVSTQPEKKRVGRPAGSKLIDNLKHMTGRGSQHEPNGHIERK